jgi:hypothetical protein
MPSSNAASFRVAPAPCRLSRGRPALAVASARSLAPVAKGANFMTPGSALR